MRDYDYWQRDVSNGVNIVCHERIRYYRRKLSFASDKQYKVIVQKINFLKELLAAKP